MLSPLTPFEETIDDGDQRAFLASGPPIVSIDLCMKRGRVSKNAKEKSVSELDVKTGHYDTTFESRLGGARATRMWPVDGEIGHIGLIVP